MALLSLQGRAARDQVITILGLAAPYPMRDMMLDYPAKVPVDDPANILIKDAQTGVRYYLCDSDGNPVPNLPEATRTAEGALLSTPPIQQDVTYTILATRQDNARATRKRHAAPFLPPQTDTAAVLETYLSQTVSIQVGLDTTLEVTFDPVGIRTQITVDYNDTLVVIIKNSQEGVLYELFEDVDDGTALSAAAERGDKGDLPILAGLIDEDQQLVGFREDIGIKVKAYRATDPNNFVFLDARVAVAVRPNPAVALSIDNAVLEHAATATLALAGTQDSAGYQLYQRLIAPAEYGSQPHEDYFEVPIDEDTSIFVEIPEPITDWNNPDDFTLVGAFAEAGDHLGITTGSLTDDVFFVVQATKRDNGETLQVTGMAAALVRPDPTLTVGVVETPVAADTFGIVTVDGTQAGVTYQLRLDADDTTVGEPGYHVSDRGLERMRVAVDLGVETQGDAQLRLPTDVLTATTVFNVLATKRITGLTAELNGKATVEVEAGG